MLKKLLGLLGDALVYGVGGILGQLIGFLLLPLYTARLSPSDYGLLAMLSIVSALFPTLAFVGMRSAIFRFYSMSKDDDERATALGVGFIVVAAVTLVLLLPCVLLSAPLGKALFGELGHERLLELALLSAAAKSIGEVPIVVLRAARRPKMTTALNLVTTLFTIGVTVLLVVGLDMGVSGVVVGALIGDLAITVVKLAVTWSYYRFRLHRELLRRMLAYGLPFLPYRLLVIATLYLSSYMIRRLMGLDDAGLYSMAERFAMPIAFVVTALSNAYPAYRFQIFTKDADPAAFFRTTVTYYVAALGYLWVGVSVWGPDVIRLLTNERFHAAAAVLPAVAFIPLVQGFYAMVNTGIEIGDDTRTMPLVGLAGLLVTGPATALLIPWLGALGAALATSLGWVVMTAVVYVLAQRNYRIPYDWTTLWVLGSLATLSVLLAGAVLKLALPYRLSFAVLVSLGYPLAVFGVLLRSPIERERMQLLRQSVFRRLRGTGQA